MQLMLAMPPSQHEHHASGYNNDSWTGLGGYAGGVHQGQGNDYQYDYASSAPMPMEPNYSINRRPSYAPPTHQMPPPLVMPVHGHGIWPSMLANSSYQQSILPSANVQTPISATSITSDMTPTSAKTSTSRRKLTDEERRLMCLEAENNPSMKQTQIGAKFNVERSTVSKILRQKDKYMKPAVKEEVTSPGKKNKIKLPDVERTLANWARNQQKKGQLITTDELRKQVQMFTSGRTDQETFTTTEWLENFQKKYLSGHKDTEAGTSHSETLDHSPVSSDGLVSPPMSAIEEIDQKYRFIGKSEDVFSFEALEYEDSPTLPHGFISDGSIGSGTLMSPISPEMNREYVTSHYVEESQPRQRSMTLPHLAAAPPKRLISKDAPPLPVRSMTVVNDMKNISIDPRQTMKRHKSVPDIHDTEVRYSSMQPPPLPRSNEMSPISPSTSLRQDEAFLALDNIKRLLEQRPDVAEADDYVMIGKLMEKLKLLRSRSPSATPILPGGMHSLDMSDSPRLSKKRTIVEMSL